jgi:succinyl-CoA synthetase beta subunit
MKIHEYQAKSLLRGFGVETPPGEACFGVDEAVAAARRLGGSLWVVKAQIHAGGRGKGGGVRLARSLDEVRMHAADILGMQLKTHQTGPQGQTVRRLLVEQGARILKELYAGLVVDRGTQRVVLMASSEGGMDIEEVAQRSPQKIHKVVIDPVEGLTQEEAEQVARLVGLSAEALPPARELLKGLYRAFVETDATLMEINPLIVTEDHRVLALDAKMNFDDNALFRHPEIVALRDLDEEDPAEVEASKLRSFVHTARRRHRLPRERGRTRHGHHGHHQALWRGPANFLDVGGGASTEKVTEAFKIMLRNPELSAILVNIFGGIMKCDVIAEGMVAAARDGEPQGSAGRALEGTNVEPGKRILARGFPSFRPMPMPPMVQAARTRGGMAEALALSRCVGARIRPDARLERDTFRSS